MNNKKKYTADSKQISRKDAMKKIGYSAFTAGTMMFLINNPAKGQEDSPGLPPDWEW